MRRERGTVKRAGRGAEKVEGSWSVRIGQDLGMRKYSGRCKWGSEGLTFCNQCKRGSGRTKRAQHDAGFLAGQQRGRNALEFRPTDNS